MLVRNAVTKQHLINFAALYYLIHHKGLFKGFFRGSYPFLKGIPAGHTQLWKLAGRQRAFAS